MRAKRAEVVQSLADVRLFSRCTAGELKTVARHVELVSFDPGDVLMEKGDPGDALFLVLAGEAEVTDGRRQLGRLGPGDHVGELALLDRAPRGATVTVVAPLDADGPRANDILPEQEHARQQQQVGLQLDDQGE